MFKIDNQPSKLFISLILFVSVTYSYAQEKDMFAKDIDKNIFRASFTCIFPDDEGWPLTFSYEREVRKPFTIFLGAGSSFRGTSNESGELAIHGFLSAEFRYYFNLIHRIKKEKPVRNFSATYLSLQESLFSGPVVLVNMLRGNAAEGKARTFLNLGLQKQFKQTYLNIFLGPGLHFNDLDKGEWVLIEDFHAGISFGLVLFE
jgi:hypothetical protein